jgi:hypothetical protein
MQYSSRYGRLGNLGEVSDRGVYTLPGKLISVVI